MADYKELLRRALEVLPQNNGAVRRAVYEKARAALVGQLRAINPPLPARDITAHRLQLEDCIRQVEQEASEASIAGAQPLPPIFAEAAKRPAEIAKTKSASVGSIEDIIAAAEKSAAPSPKPSSLTVTPANRQRADGLPSKPASPDPVAVPVAARLSDVPGDLLAEIERAINASGPTSHTVPQPAAALGNSKLPSIVARAAAAREAANPPGPRPPELSSPAPVPNPGSNLGATDGGSSLSDLLIARGIGLNSRVAQVVGPVSNDALVSDAITKAAPLIAPPASEPPPAPKPTAVKKGSRSAGQKKKLTKPSRRFGRPPTPAVIPFEAPAGSYLKSIFLPPAGPMELDYISVMMPFPRDFDRVFECIVGAGFNQGFFVERADQKWENQAIIESVYSMIFRSNVVVCDFTGRNPNVMYEAGLAHALGRKVVPITRDSDELPFDIRHHHAMVYENSDGGLEKLGSWLEKSFKASRTWARPAK